MGDQRVDSGPNRGRRVRMIIRVRARYRIDQKSITARIDPAVFEGVPDGGDHRDRCVGRAALLADDDALPLLEKLVGP